MDLCALASTGRETSFSFNLVEVIAKEAQSAAADPSRPFTVVSILADSTLTQVQSQYPYLPVHIHPPPPPPPSYYQRSICVAVSQKSGSELMDGEILNSWSQSTRLRNVVSTGQAY